MIIDAVTLNKFWSQYLGEHFSGENHFLIFLYARCVMIFHLLCVNFFSATHTRRSCGVCMDAASLNAPTEARHRSVDVVHHDHGDAVSFLVLHEPSPAECDGFAARAIGCQQLDEA